MHQRVEARFSLVANRWLDQSIATYLEMGKWVRLRPSNSSSLALWMRTWWSPSLNIHQYLPCRNWNMHDGNGVHSCKHLRESAWYRSGIFAFCMDFVHVLGSDKESMMSFKSPTCSYCRGVLFITGPIEDSPFFLSRRLWIPPLSEASTEAALSAGCRYAVSRKLLTSRLGSSVFSKLSFARASWPPPSHGRQLLEELNTRDLICMVVPVLICAEFERLSNSFTMWRSSRYLFFERDTFLGCHSQRCFYESLQ